MGFDQSKLVELLRRSYFAVDGLWFMMAEKERGFEDTLGLDERVWQVMPKIQARKARELLRLRGATLAELAQCFALKLTSEGHRFEVVWHGSEGLEFVISRCPWLDMLQRADQEIADRVAAEVGRHKAELQPAVRVAHVLVRPPADP